MSQLASKTVVAFVVAAAGVIGVASCANTSSGNGDAGSDAAVNPCGPGTAVKCGDTCVDTQSDFQNCGSCGTKCADTEVCSHGACATVCGGGTTRCGNDCVDTSSDVNHCGTCTLACPTGNVCNKGTCAVTCQDGLTDCNGDCVDVTQNDDNCGACGQPCASGQVCSAGKCVATCQAGWSSCSVGDAGATTCVDTRYDTNNCGACNTPCPGGELCSPVNGVGACSLQCNGGTSKCSGACVDESIDPSNCGACGATCAGSCSAGHCCGAGQIYCGACDTVANCTIKTGGALTAGYAHTCAITSNGVLKCWGYGVDGQLGDGKATSSGGPVTPTLSGSAIFVGAGANHTCAVVAGGKAYCWGYGFSGELGDGNATQENAPSPVSLTGAATRIDGGGDDGCAIMQGGGLMCWGGNFYGDVGNNASFVKTDTPVTTVPPIADAVELSAGLGYNACALLTNGQVKCWGENDYGECGDNNPNNFEDDFPVDVVDTNNAPLTNVTHVAVGAIHSCAIVSSGEVYCWGDDAYGELGDGATATMSWVPVKAAVSNVTQLALGGEEFNYSHTCALTSAGAVFCWGSNDVGQIGNNNASATPVLTPYEVFASGITAIAAGAAHTCAMKNDSTVWCWGNNSDGELGDLTTTNSSVPVQVKNF